MLILQTLREVLLILVIFACAVLAVTFTWLFFLESGWFAVKNAVTAFLLYACVGALIMSLVLSHRNRP